MHLYVTRHGQTQWNALDKVLGRTDVPLDETGLAQAGALARSLKGEPIDLILTSPLTRTVQTGAAVAQELGIPSVTADELIEMDFGIYEGVPRSDPVYQAAKAQYFSRYPGGESFLDIAARVYPFLRTLPERADEILAQQKGDGEHVAESDQMGTGDPGTARESLRGILLVTHNGICRVISSYFTGMSNDEFRTFVLPNCAVMRYEL